MYRGTQKRSWKENAPGFQQDTCQVLPNILVNYVELDVTQWNGFVPNWMIILKWHQFVDNSISGDFPNDLVVFSHGWYIRKTAALQNCRIHKTGEVGKYKCIYPWVGMVEASLARACLEDQLHTLFDLVKGTLWQPEPLMWVTDFISEVMCVHKSILNHTERLNLLKV